MHLLCHASFFSPLTSMQISMPGMMDTVLNLGLNDTAVEGLAAKYGERFAMDCYRRLLQMFGDVVLNIPHHDFEQEIVAMKAARGVKFDVELTAADLRELVTKYKAVYVRHSQSLPDDPWEQLAMGIDAVFRCGGCCCGLLPVPCAAWQVLQCVLCLVALQC